MRRSSPGASAAGGDDTDLRSQLFASHRKTIQATSLVAASKPSCEAPKNSLVSPDSRAQPTTLNSSTSPVVKPVAKPQTMPIIDGDTSVATVSPLAADVSGGASLESLQEELNRRKTHNVSSFNPCLRCCDTFYMHFSKKLCCKKKTRLHQLSSR